MILGVFFNTILYGILIVQVFIYYRTYKKDPTWIKLFVAYLFVMETFNTGFDIGIMLEPLIIRYGTERATTIAPIMLFADPIVTVFISSPVQFFIAWRIRIMSKSNVLTAVICVLSLCSFIGGVATTIAVSYIPQFARFQEFDGAVITWLVPAAITDILITISLVCSLRRSRTGMKATNDAISRIIRLTVQTGTVTSVSASMDVIFFVGAKHTSLNFMWDFALSKLYTNSLISTLNARTGWSNVVNHEAESNVLFHTERVPAGQLENRDSFVLTSGVFEPEPSFTYSEKTQTVDLENGHITTILGRLDSESSQPECPIDADCEK